MTAKQCSWDILTDHFPLRQALSVCPNLIWHLKKSSKYPKHTLPLQSFYLTFTFLGSDQELLIYQVISGTQTPLSWWSRQGEKETAKNPTKAKFCAPSGSSHQVQQTGIASESPSCLNPTHLFGGQLAAVSHSSTSTSAIFCALEV